VRVRSHVCVNVCVRARYLISVGTRCDSVLVCVMGLYVSIVAMYAHINIQELTCTLCIRVCMWARSHVSCISSRDKHSNMCNT